MSRDSRVRKLERAVAHHYLDGRISVLYVTPQFEARGYPLGLHATGSPRSGYGMLVYDPVDGFPAVPYDQLAPSVCVVVLDPNVE